MDAPWQALGEARERVARLPRWHLRRVGLRLLELGVLILVVSLPIKVQAVYTGLVLAILGTLLAGLPLYRLPGFWWAAWFAVLQIVTDLAGPWQFGTGGSAVTWLTIYVCAAGLLSPRLRRLALTGLVISTILTVALALAQVGLGYTNDVRPLRLATFGARWSRVGSLHGPPTWGNIMLGISLIFCSAAACRGLGRRLRLEALTLALIGMTLAVLRMTYLALMAALAVWGILRGGRAGRRLAWAIPAVLIIGTACLFLLDRHRFLNTLAGEDGRWPIWRAGLGIISQHPWFGVGTEEGFRMAFIDAHSHQRLLEFGWGYFNLHNSYLTLWAQHGIITLLAYLGWLAALCVGIRRRHRPGNAAWPFTAALVTAILVLGCFDHFAGRPFYHFPMYVALGLALALGLEEETHAPDPLDATVG